MREPRLSPAAERYLTELRMLSVDEFAEKRIRDERELRSARARVHRKRSGAR
jgi:hypothetical protein